MDMPEQIPTYPTKIPSSGSGASVETLHFLSFPLFFMTVVQITKGKKEKSSKTTKHFKTKYLVLSETIPRYICRLVPQLKTVTISVKQFSSAL